MFSTLALAVLASCGSCCGSKADSQVIQPVINNNIFSTDCRSSKGNFIKELVHDARSMNAECGSLDEYDSGTEIDVHVRVRSETHSHIDTSSLQAIAKKSGHVDLIEEKQYK